GGAEQLPRLVGRSPGNHARSGRAAGQPCWGRALSIQPLTKSPEGAWRLPQGLDAPWGYAVRRSIMLADDQSAAKPPRARATVFFLSAPQSYEMASGHTRSRDDPSTYPSRAYLRLMPDPR